MFRLAEALGVVYQDWCIPIDADERFQNVEGVRDLLGATELDRYSFRYVTPDADMSDEERHLTNLGTDTRSTTITRCLRVLPGMRVDPPTHWLFSGIGRDGGRISLRPAQAHLEDFHILHQTMRRPLDRKTLKAEYITARNAIGET
jgi:hypothetical protein